MRKSIIYLFLPLIILCSCNDFLDTMPDDRAELNNATKVTSLLVSAYPDTSPTLIAELSSDNAKDNGTLYTPFSREQEDAYLWKDIETTSFDSPSVIWNSHYGAVASANQALYAIEELEGSENMEAQKGEALICRAYAHFALASLFCLPYNPETSSNDMGIPYSMKPEVQAVVSYERGTMEDLYIKINDDIEAALPLINDELYSVTKYHFNKRAAYAFAARFNLFYLKFDKAVKYATLALGDNPGSSMTKWKDIDALPSNYSLRCDRFIDERDPGNYMLITARTLWPYIHGPYSLAERYGNAQEIVRRESLMGRGPWPPYVGIASTNMIPAKSTWGNDRKSVATKLGAYFEYFDRAAGIGILHMVLVPFSVGETLLCRAEAHILQNNYAEGVADINQWLEANCSSVDPLSPDEIVSFYQNVPYMPIQITDQSQRTVKKHINPVGFVVSPGLQEGLIHCLLHLRRIETIHDGSRWYDIKRYGIEISHNRDGMADDILLKDDPRRAVQLPQDVIGAGLAANPRN